MRALCSDYVPVSILNLHEVVLGAGARLSKILDKMVGPATLQHLCFGSSQSTGILDPSSENTLGQLSGVSVFLKWYLRVE